MPQACSFELQHKELILQEHMHTEYTDAVTAYTLNPKT